MKSYIHILLCMGFFMQSLGKLQAQHQEQIRLEIQAINGVYEKAKAFSQEMEIKVFPDWQASLPIEVMNGWIKKQGDKQRSRFDQVEYVVLSDQMLSLDHGKRIMIWMENQQPTQTQNYEVDLDQLLAQCSDVSLEENGDESRIRFSFKSGRYDNIEVFYERKRHLITKVRWYFAQKQYISQQYPQAKPWMEMSFHHIDLSPKWEKGTFSISRFLKRNSKGEFTLASSYQDYQLISY